MATTSRVILVCSGKGGVGKTTLTANLGVALARGGQHTVVIDADFGLRNLDLLLGLERVLCVVATTFIESITAGQASSGIAPKK